MNAEHITDEQLSAWVDGELEAAERERVSAWLQQHPEDAARVCRWSAERDALRALWQPVVDEPVPERLRAVVWTDAAARRPRWAMAAAAAGLLLAGGLVGGGVAWKWQHDQYAQVQAQAQARQTTVAAQGWVERATLAHSVYVPEPRHAVEVKAQEEHLARWLTRRVEVPVRLYDLRSQGFDLVGGRLLPDGSGKSAQLMYQDAQGLRVTLYLRKPEKGTEVAFSYERHGDLGTFFWVEEKCGYALVGALPRETLLAMAESIEQQEDQLDAAAKAAASQGGAVPAKPVPQAPPAAPRS